VPRLGHICAAVLVVASFAAGPAAAQTTFAPEDIFLGVQHEPDKNLSDAEIRGFFNRAKCNCDEPVFLYLALNPSGVSKIDTVTRDGSLQVWVGNSCENPLQRSQCQLLVSTPIATFLDQGSLTVQTSARVLSTESTPGGDAFPAGGNPTCTTTVPQYTQKIYVLLDTDGDGFPEVSSTHELLIDLTPPPAPDSNAIGIEEANEALDLRWPTVDQTLTPDLHGYQLLCIRGGYLQVFDEGTFAPAFESCPSDVAAAGGGIAGLDPLFVCSPRLPPTTTSYQIAKLQNDIAYGAAVVAVDNNGNASTPDIFYGTPGGVPSFYGKYRMPEGGPAGATTGGFCAVAGSDASGRTIWGTSLGLALAAGMLFARRRRRR
jgi:MYXO-CTERM domain-containing protein